MQDCPTQLTIAHPSFALWVPWELGILFLNLRFFPRWEDKAAQLQGEVVATKLSRWLSVGLEGPLQMHTVSVLGDKLG